MNGRVARLYLSVHSALPLALFNVLFAGLLGLMLWSEYPLPALKWWALLAVALSAIDVATRLAAGRRAQQGSDYLGIFWPAAAIDAAIGLLWLYAAVAFFPSGVTDLQFYSLFAIGASALCTAVYQHYWLPGCFLRIGVALPVAAFQVFNTNIAFSPVRSLIVIAVWIAIVWLALKLHQSFMQRLQLTVNRDALLRQVEESARELDVLRAEEADSRARAEKANLSKSRFLAHSSHDLRQPLHAIRLLLETVDDTALDAASRHVIDRVRHSTDALGKLFDSLLDLTLLDTGQMAVREQNLALHSLLAEVAEDFAELARSNNVRLVVDTPELSVRADATILRRMVQNLVANAIRHTPDGTVVLRGRKSDGNTWVDVDDTGAGIAAADQERIFEEFTRINGESSADGAGQLGLGLSIVSRLARLTGVDVTLDSEPGRGSRFTLGPFRAVATSDAPAAGRALTASALSGLAVAVLDDDRETLEATGKLLEKWGLRVSVAGSVAELDAAAADILVCDVELGPGPDGIEVVRQVRSTSNPAIKALLISGNTSRELETRAAAESLTLLHKPVQPAQLKSAILTLVGSQ